MSAEATARERARQPEDLTRLFMERANASDPEGMAELYEPDAVLALPGQSTTGREAIHGVFEQMVAEGTWLRVPDRPDFRG